MGDLSAMPFILGVGGVVATNILRMIAREAADAGCPVDLVFWGFVHFDASSLRSFFLGTKCL